MIKESCDKLIDSNAQALVNTVNTVGVMGKGVALLFKERFPENYLHYRKACKSNEVRVGRMLVYRQVSPHATLDIDERSTKNEKCDNPEWIINFPTKQHWRDPSKIEWIEQGLIDLTREVKESDIRSIALPQLGCGNGGLDWKEVKPLICDAFKDLVDVEVTIHIYQETGVE